MSTRSHSDYKDNIGAYVLGALPELEAEVLERHLAGCDECRADVAELQPVTNAIARSVPQVEPPASLKKSLMETVDAEAAVRSGSEGRARLQWRGIAAWLGGARPRLAMAGALAVLAIGVVIGVTAGQVSRDAGSRTVAARIDRKLMPAGGAALEVTGDRSRATLKLTGAPAPPAGRVYQLWVQRGKTVERGPVFTVRGGSAAKEIPGGVRGANTVMVTLERAGGANAPTGPPIMSFTV